MSLVTAKIDIDGATPEQVWAFVMDPQRMNDWVTISRSVDKCDSGEPVTGFEMEQTLCLRGVNFKVKWNLAEAEKPSFARWEGTGPARSKALTEYRLQAHDGGTRFDYRNEFKTPLGPLGAAASRVLVGGISEREAKASLQQLKSRLESD